MWDEEANTVAPHHVAVADGGGAGNTGAGIADDSLMTYNDKGWDGLCLRCGLRVHIHDGQVVEYW